MAQIKWTIGRRLAAAFGGVLAILLVTVGANIVLSGQAESAWHNTEKWDRATHAAANQVRGISEQAAAQANAVATMDPAYVRVFNSANERLTIPGAKTIATIGDPVIAGYVMASRASDLTHDATVAKVLFPAVRRGDRAAALTALTKANRFLGASFQQTLKIQGRVDALRANDVARAESRATQAHNFGLIAAGLGILLAGLLAFFVTRSITRPLGRLQSAAERAATGDLTASVHSDSRDEVGEVSRAFDRMVGSLREVIGTVVEAAHTVTKTSARMVRSADETGTSIGEIAATMDEVARGSTDQAQATQGVSDTASQIAEGATQVALAARTAAEAAEVSDSSAQAGSATVAQATAAMHRIEERVASAAEVVASLGDKGQAIGDIIRTITEIASQTNLLALNAAIEAARAGEQGRGFAVVAEEVRKLAEGSQTAAGSIAGIIADIQTETQRAVSAMDAGQAEVTEGATRVLSAGDAFAEIREQVAKLSAEVGHVAASAEQLRTGAAHVQNEVISVASVSEENAAAAQEVCAGTQMAATSAQDVVDSASELEAAAAQLTSLVERFTV